MDFANSSPNSLRLCFYTLLIILSSLLLSSVFATTPVSCLPDQSYSLLQLKRGFFQSDLTSWQPGTDCCRDWEGVSCNEATGHVTALNISNRNIEGNLNAAIFNLTSLQHLNLAYNDFSQNQIPINGFEKLTMLTHLSLSNCNFSGEIPSSIEKLGKLATLYLYGNSFSGSIPPSLFSLPNLEELYLSENKLSGQFRLNESSSFQFSPLIKLDLSENQLDGPIPWQIFKFSNLQTLNLSWNQFSGPIPNSIVCLPSLFDLDLSSNNFNGTFDFNLLPCNLSQILRNASQFGYVGLSKNQLHGAIPRLIWERFSGAWLDLSHNMFTSAEDVPPGLSFGIINFSFNKLKGAVPLVDAEILDYSNNEFSEIPLNFVVQPGFLNLSTNMLTGEIPSSICEASISILDLSYNNLSGSIPSCIIGSRDMQVLSLRGNKLSGILSRHISRSCAFLFLDLNSNNLEGNLPRSLTRCKDLVFLDIGNNRIGGTFPFSLGKLPNLQVIVLRSNRFYGTLEFPPSFGKMNSSFPLLRIIDLASNNFHGSLPPLWFNNFKSIQNLSSDGILSIPSQISVTITYKGAQMTLEHDLVYLMNSIDLSSNRFTGDIPEIIGELKGIKELNLSHNSFTGYIPNRLGELTQIESLDLSWNQLSGEIPQELTALTSLSVLNLSFNHLVRRIPQSNQFSTFQNSTFEGNPGLCGVPLSKLCNVQIPGNNSTSPSTKPSKKMTAIVLLCLFIGLGFGTGFATAIVIPVTKRARKAHATR